MIVTVSKIPVPEPMAPRKSATMVKAPMHIPPKVAAVGMYLLNISLVPESVCPRTNIPSLFRFLATSSGPCPENSIHVLLNSAQARLMKWCTSDDEDDVDDSVDWIAEHFNEVSGWGEEVDEATNWDGLSTIDFLPITEQLNEITASETSVKHLTEEVKIADEGCLENNGHVAGVEQLNGVATAGTLLAAGKWEVDLEALEVDDHAEDQHCGEDIADVW